MFEASCAAKGLLGHVSEVDALTYRTATTFFKGLSDAAAVSLAFPKSEFQFFKGAEQIALVVLLS